MVLTHDLQDHCAVDVCYGVRAFELSRLWILALAAAALLPRLVKREGSWLCCQKKGEKSR